jgi:hypothetical protein
MKTQSVGGYGFFPRNRWLTLKFVSQCESKGIEASVRHIDGMNCLLVRIKFPNGYVKYISHAAVSMSESLMQESFQQVIKSFVEFDHVGPAKPKELAKRIFSGEFQLPTNGDYI